MLFLGFHVARYAKNGIINTLEERQHQKMLDSMTNKTVEEIIESVRKSNLLRHNIFDIFSDEVYLPIFNTKIGAIFLFFYFSITFILIIFVLVYLVANFSDVKREYLKLLKSQKIYSDNKKKLKANIKTSGPSTIENTAKVAEL